MRWKVIGIVVLVGFIALGVTNPHEPTLVQLQEISILVLAIVILFQLRHAKRMFRSGGGSTPFTRDEVSQDWTRSKAEAAEDRRWGRKRDHLD